MGNKENIVPPEISRFYVSESNFRGILSEQLGGTVESVEINDEKVNLTLSCSYLRELLEKRYDKRVESVNKNGSEEIGIKLDGESGKKEIENGEESVEEGSESSELEDSEDDEIDNENSEEQEEVSESAGSGNPEGNESGDENTMEQEENRDDEISRLNRLRSALER